MVKELLGHSSFEMTLRYAHLAPNQKAEAVKALDGAAKDGYGVKQGAVGARVAQERRARYSA